MTIRLEAGNCPFCTKPSFIDLPDEVAIRVVEWFNTGRQGYIQDVFPELTIAQREVLLTATHDECFDEAFPEDE